MQAVLCEIISVIYFPVERYDNYMIIELCIITVVLFSGLHNPLDMMYHIQPWMIVGLLPLSAAFEGIILVDNTANKFPAI